MDDTVVDGKTAIDVLKSKRFISFIVYIVVTYLLFPLGQELVPSVFGTLNPVQVMEQMTTVVMVVIGGYSAQDALSALRKK